MKTNMRHLLAVAVAALSLGVFAEVDWKSSGSYSVGASKDITVPASDDVYYKLSVSKGNEYTFVATDKSASPASDVLSIELVCVYVDNEDTSKEEYYETWMYGADDMRTTGSVRLQIGKEDLEYTEGYTVKGWYLKVSNGSSESLSVRLTSSKGIIDEPIPEGDYENPKKITASEREIVVSGDVRKVMDGEYCIDVYGVEYGQRYHVWTEGGSAENQTEIWVGGEVDVLVGDFAGDNDAAVIVTPKPEYDEGDPLELTVCGCAGSFKLHFKALPERLPEAHPYATLGVVGTETLSADCQPGRAVSTGSPYYDVVIDEELFQVTLAKGARYAFRAIGMTKSTPVKIQLCDAQGEEVAVRYGSGDLLIVYEVPQTVKTLTYYVGVCQDISEEDPLEVLACSVEAVRLTEASATLLDDYDNGDDTYAGATGVDFAAGRETVSASHTLGLTDWADWFRIDARSGIAYAVKGVWQDGAVMPTNLLVDVYKANGTSLGTLVKAGVNLMKGYQIASSKKNESYLLHVYVQDGEGLDAGPYALVSSVSATTGVGSLKVCLQGPQGDSKSYWQLRMDGSTGPKYTDGASVILAADTWGLMFGTPTGWSAIGDQYVEVEANEITEVTFRYADTFSPRDDVLTGATQLTFKKADQTVERSLWGSDGDMVDWFKFTGDAGTYYSIALSARGDATTFVLCDAAGKTVATPSETGLLVWSCAVKGTYTVKVENGGGDALYALTYSSAKVGEVKLDKAVYSVKSTAATVDVKVKRTQNEGRVRVRYTTLADSAVPGVHYDTAKGVLEWEDGDKTDRVISIKLIPDLKNAYRGDVRFGIALSTLPEAQLEPNEWTPSLGTPSAAVVTVQEANKLVPGTVTFAGYSVGGKMCQFADAKKPTVTADPGQVVTVYLDRTLGTDGDIAVKAETVKGSKTVPGVDYDPLPADTTLVWLDGDDTLMPVDLPLTEQDNRVAGKTFTLKLTALGTGTSKPTLAATTLTVTIDVNDFTPQKATDLPLAENPVPVDAKGLVSLGGADEGVVPLAWTGSNGYAYYVSVADNKNKLDDETYANRHFYEVEGDTAVAADGIEADKTWFWRVDTVYYSADGEELVRKNTKTWSFKAVSNVAQTMVTDANGVELTEGETMVLRQGVQTTFALGVSEADDDDVFKYAVAGGKLPDGLKLDAQKGVVTGVPTKAGVFSAAFQTTVGKTASATITVNFEVLSAGVAVGTFQGVGQADTTSELPDLMDLGAAAITVDTKGGITAKFTFGTTAYTFKRTGTTAGFDAYEETCSDLMGAEGYVVTMDAATKASDGKTMVTNIVTLAVPCGAETDAEALAQPAAWTLTLKAGTEDESVVRGLALRDSKKLTAVAAALAAWEGYYTVSLPPVNAQDGEPQGAGYITVTVDAKGGVKLGGTGADGVNLTASSILGFTTYEGTVDEGLVANELLIPVYLGKKTSCLGGFLRLVRVDLGGETWTVADPGETLRWISVDAAAARLNPAGFDLTLEPTGGYFDKLSNLTAYYLNTAVAFDIGTFATDEAASLAPIGYDTLLAYPGAFESPLAVSTAGNALSVDKKSLVKKVGSKTLTDLENSVNASNVSLKFTRATGIFSGTFSLWYGDAAYGSETKQKEVTGIKYAGVLTPCKYAGAYFNDPGIGYINAVETIGKTKWTGSWLLRLAGTDITEENEDRWTDEGWDDEN